jgi:hypothetical protein
MPRRLVIEEERRDEIREAALDAAFQANDGREIGYTTEKLIKEAVEAAINKTEEILT